MFCSVANRRRVLAGLLLMSLCIISCGIETFAYLYPPRRDYENSNLDDESKRYCRFITADSSNDPQYFKGTEIYYRIYEKESDCTADISMISTKNDNNPSGVVEYILGTKKYALLGRDTSPSGSRPLIGRAASDQTVRFRLQDYGGDPAGFTLNGTPWGIPYRSSDIIGNKMFNSSTIHSSDSDVFPSSSPSTSYFFVNFYAASYGYDKNFRTLYSSAAHLGYIKLNK